MAAPLRKTPSVEKDLSEVAEKSSAMKTIITRAEDAKTKAAMKWQAAKVKVLEKAKVARAKSVELSSDKSVQATAASVVGGATVGGIGGATGGLLLGGATGAVLGVLPALFTFGLSIPIGAALGAGCGLLMGGATGTATGAGVGGAAGYSAYTRRDEIASFIEQVRAKLVEALGKGKCTAAEAKAKAGNKIEDARVKAIDTFTLAKGFVMSHIAAAKETTLAAVNSAGGKATEMAQVTKVKTIEIASDKQVQVTAASAAGEAAVGEIKGAAVGFATGGAVGAAVGVVPAFFTFGLSIPLFAAIGSGCGLATGAVVGGATGLVGGGATGFGVYTKRDAIGSSVTKTLSQVDSAAKVVKRRASDSADYVRNRLVGGTGGTTD
eukprot:CAMPEP_0115184636 /NCGR_PEP_ID=MMETSP0270-20121206/9063_1 /TAXON_ID=71861 /ORGANISM="Scrippsiella trochoidea, Strain CCMP3099" /LENGTH=379 /DNA_ID=CAMNT_0002597725 /DNA_START=61 /DNA_END=1200 /DNA_ORIENTATION=-